MADINVVTLTGRLTKDPQVRKTKNGKSVCTFTLAVNGLNEEVNFLQIVVWDKQAENLERYQKKGNKLAVDGAIRTSSWQNQDGSMNYKTDIIAKDISFLDSKTQSNQTQAKPTEPTAQVEITNEDLPF